MERKVQGQDVSEEQIDQWVAEAEAGFDPSWLEKRMERPAHEDRAPRAFRAE